MATVACNGMEMIPVDSENRWTLVKCENYDDSSNLQCWVNILMRSRLDVNPPLLSPPVTRRAKCSAVARYAEVCRLRGVLFARYAKVARLSRVLAATSLCQGLTVTVRISCQMCQGLSVASRCMCRALSGDDALSPAWRKRWRIKYCRWSLRGHVWPRDLSKMSHLT